MSMPEIPPEESFIEYPCDFPVKAMGIASDEFKASVLAIGRQHDPEFTEASVTERESKKGNYISLTLMIKATSREQLDSIYRDLTSCDQVKWVM